VRANDLHDVSEKVGLDIDLDVDEVVTLVVLR
jgi:hypothetical protein